MSPTQKQVFLFDFAVAMKRNWFKLYAGVGGVTVKPVVSCSVVLQQTEHHWGLCSVQFVLAQFLCSSRAKAHSSVFSCDCLASCFLDSVIGGLPSEDSGVSPNLREEAATALGLSRKGKDQIMTVFGNIRCQREYSQTAPETTPQSIS